MYVDRVENLQAGDVIDLRGDIFADFDRNSQGLKDGDQKVESVEPVGGGMVKVGYLHRCKGSASLVTVTFPAGHRVRVVD